MKNYFRVFHLIAAIVVSPSLLLIQSPRLAQASDEVASDEVASDEVASDEVASDEVASNERTGDERVADAELSAVLLPLLSAHDGDVGVAIENLETGDFFQYQPDRPMPTASLIKLPIMITVYRAVERGEIEPGGEVSLKEDDKVPGSGLLTNHFSAGVVLPIRDYIRLMMRYSDNTATNIVIDQIGLPATADCMETLGFEETKLHSKVFRGSTTIFPDRSRRFGLGSTTADETLRLLKALWSGELAGEKLTTDMISHLKACEDRSKLPRFLPASVKIAHKTGSISNCRTDAGVIETAGGPVAVCVLTNKNADKSWGDDNDAEVLIGRVGEAIVARYGSNKVSRDLRNGSFGEMVETLQRTLNARLDPSPQLSIDGDFGPATEAAVRKFQTAQELPSTGIVDAATWTAMGTLIEQDAPVPDPDVVNSQTLPTQPETDYEQPPIVTAKAWIIADPQSGQTIAEDQSDVQREPASTTKLMTALLVAEYADRHPDCLDEIVTITPDVDRTRGSSAKLRTDERYRVNQLMYGLLLPSGNDAAVALASHFGDRLETEQRLDREQLDREQSDKDDSDNKAEEESSYDRFIAAMNRRAEQLEMKRTHFQNPHGLPDAEHLTTAKDLATLAAHALTLPLIRKVVATRQFGCRIESERGYRRNVVWKNTNRLLGIDGYRGVKTGTTGAAGACLVAFGNQDDRSRIVVILGSSSSAARYADSRNLFRWSWSDHNAQGHTETASE